MTTLYQMHTYGVLQASGLQCVSMPISDSDEEGPTTPIPGLLLLGNVEHTKLMMVQPDGTAVNLLEVFRAAEDCIRNWHEGMLLSLPHFVGDFGRLTRIAIAVNGEKVEPPPPGTEP